MWGGGVKGVDIYSVFQLASSAVKKTPPQNTHADSLVVVYFNNVNKCEISRVLGVRRVQETDGFVARRRRGGCEWPVRLNRLDA